MWHSAAEARPSPTTRHGTKDGSGNARQREYEALYVIWRAWGLERLGDANTIEEYISKIEDFEDNDGRPQINPRPTARTLRHYFCGCGICRARINARGAHRAVFRLYPVYPHGRHFRAIAESKSATDVDHDAAFTGIPERVQQTEQEIQSFKAQFAPLSIASTPFRIPPKRLRCWVRA